MSTIEIGTGVLNWNRGERIGDRYGAVGLWSEPGWDNLNATQLILPELPIGARGKLVAEVIATRDSSHIGDFFRGLFPETPEVGEVIELGEGTLFIDQSGGGTHVGLAPDDEREHDWLDPEKLYRVHDQTVRLTFVTD